MLAHGLAHRIGVAHLACRRLWEPQLLLLRVPPLAVLCLNQVPQHTLLTAAAQQESSKAHACIDASFCILHWTKHDSSPRLTWHSLISPPVPKTRRCTAFFVCSGLHGVHSGKNGGRRTADRGWRGWAGGRSDGRRSAPRSCCCEGGCCCAGSALRPCWALPGFTAACRRGDVKSPAAGV